MNNRLIQHRCCSDARIATLVRDGGGRGEALAVVAADDGVGGLRVVRERELGLVREEGFASSSSIDGPKTPLPAEESAPANPCRPFALTKLRGEQ